jgi:hypothetical protein
MKNKTENLITFTQAAQLRGVTKQAISKLARKGRFTVTEIGPHKFLERHEVEQYVPRKNGRPPNPSGKKTPPKTADNKPASKDTEK